MIVRFLTRIVGAGTLVLSLVLLSGCPQSILTADLAAELEKLDNPEYTVSYNANGTAGATIPSDITVRSGSTVTVEGPTNGLLKRVSNGLDFVYWNTDPDGTGSVYQPRDTLTMPDSDVTLYATCIGDHGPTGGYIYYHDEDDEFPGWDFLEAAATDESDSKFCNYLYYTPTQTDYQAIGSGPSNTDAIVGYEEHTLSAAQLCRFLGPEWFLPSEFELIEMYDILHRNGIGGFLDDIRYWSSSLNGEHARAVRFTDGQVQNEGRSNVFHVRASRAF